MGTIIELKITDDKGEHKLTVWREANGDLHLVSGIPEKYQAIVNDLWAGKFQSII